MTTRPIGELRWALGLMSGTSLDGVDAALIETDGVRITRYGPSLTHRYDDTLRHRLRNLLAVVAAAGDGSDAPDLAEITRDLTLRHVEAVRELRAMAPDIVPDVIGFHGQTILHRPQDGRSWQIGDAGLLQACCGVRVVHDFRANDLSQGGEGAPLVPVMHAALLHDVTQAVAVLNIGGVANVTLLGPQEGGARMLWACDTGPGNALLDDWALRHTGTACDVDGALAARGKVVAPVLEALLDQPYFSRKMPKSLDRLSFHDHALRQVAGLAPEDGAATLAAFTIETIARTPLAVTPAHWLVAGGGRHNPVLMRGLTARLGDVRLAETAGWEGDALEAQCFGLLAVRFLDGLPSSWPSTTGVSGPCVAGRSVEALIA